MEALVRSWTRVDRPASGVPAGRVVVLVDCSDGVRRYALWEGPPPVLDQPASIEQREGLWRAAPPGSGNLGS